MSDFQSLPNSRFRESLTTSEPQNGDVDTFESRDQNLHELGLISNRYVLEERIARGAMGSIYRATDRSLNRVVAVKILRTKHLTRPEIVRRFIEEGRITAKLQHPGVPPVFDSGNLNDGRPFFALKLIDGQTLAELLHARSSPAIELPRFLGVFETLVQTIAFAHRQSVIHRDLRPENVLVGTFGEVQVIDWGHARKLNDLPKAPPADGTVVDLFDPLAGAGFAPGDDDTQTSGIHSGVLSGIHRPMPKLGLGTAPNNGDLGIASRSPLAPEQARKAGEPVDRRSDVFGLGAILCRILTGEGPYVGTPEEMTGKAQLGNLSDAMSRLARCGADPVLVTIAQSCLEPQPQHRPADAGAIADLLAEYQRGIRPVIAAGVRPLGSASFDSMADGVRRKARDTRGSLGRGILAAVVIVAVASAIAYAWIRHERRSGQDRLDAETARIDHRMSEWLTDARSALALAERTDRTWPERRAAAERSAGVARFAETARRPETAKEAAAVLRQADSIERAARLVASLQSLRPVLLERTERRFEPDSAARRIYEALTRHGFDPMNGSESTSAESLQRHPARREIIPLLPEWAALTTDPQERLRAAALLRAVDGSAASLAWIAAIQADDWEKLARPEFTLGVPECSPNMVVIIARRLQRANRGSAADALIRRGSERFPQSALLHEESAHTYLAVDQASPKAIAHLTAAAAGRPGCSRILISLSRCLDAAKRHEEALGALRSAVDSDPDGPEPIVDLARRFVSRGDRRAAINVLTPLVIRHPGHTVGQLLAGEVAVAESEWVMAESAFRNVLRTEPKHDQAKLGLARTLIGRGDAESAVEELRGLIASGGPRAEERAMLAECLRSLKRHDEAVLVVQKGLEASPKNATLHRIQGQLMIDRKDYDAAHRSLESALAANPKDVSALQASATVAEIRGNVDTALDRLRRWSELAPNDSTAVARHGILLLRSGREWEAAQLLRTAAERFPTDPVIRINAGQTLLLFEDPSAVPHLEFAVAHAPGSGELHAALAEAYMAAGKFRSAASSYRSAVDKSAAGTAMRDQWQAAARRATQWAGLEAHTGEILKGNWVGYAPATLADAAEVLRRTGKYSEAVELYRYLAGPDGRSLPEGVIAAVRAAENSKLPTAKRIVFIQTALDWLRRLPDSARMLHDRRMQRIRVSSAIGLLPPDDRTKWNALFDAPTVKGR